MIVVKTLSGTNGVSSPATNCSSSSATSSERKILNSSFPQTRIARADGIRAATSSASASFSGYSGSER